MWLFDLVGLPKRVKELESEVKTMAVDLQGLQDELALVQQQADAQDGVLTGIAQDYNTLAARIADLEAANNDPALQAQIDDLKVTAAAIRAKLQQNNAALATLDESVAPPAPPEP
jgi:chromosome segregation ATPase